MEPSTAGAATAPAAYHYRVLRTELTALAADLSPQDLATPVPALPGWTVHDTYAHLAGVCANLLDGDRGRPEDPDWTARQVAVRRTLPTTAVLAEWNRRAAQLEEFLADPAGRPAIYCVFDVFHHTHDIRGALRRPAGRTGDQAAFVAATMAKLNRKPWAAAVDRPTITLATAAGTWQLGDGEPLATLTTSDFELSRILIGRRSRAQMLAAGWTGQPTAITAAAAHLPAFGPPTEDLLE
jgi:uncharacterized protein (TIGR03083 family)